MSLNKKYKFILSGLIMVLWFLVSGSAVLATSPGATNALDGLDNTAKAGGINPTDKDLPTIIGGVVGAALSFLGVIFFILIIYGGYMWMFSMGNEQTTGKAKEIIIAAVVGLIIVLMAYAITSYIGTTVGAVK